MALEWEEGTAGPVGGLAEDKPRRRGTGNRCPVPYACGRVMSLGAGWALLGSHRVTDTSGTGTAPR
jgi:hypothetical protein